MNRILGTFMLVAAVGAVGAQEPPTPPARPARPARPVEAPRQAPAPRVATPHPVYAPHGVVPSMLEIDELRLQAAEVARAAREFNRELPRLELDAMRVEAARVAQEARELNREINHEAIAQAREMAHVAREDARRAHEELRLFEPIRPMAPMAPITPMLPMEPMPAMAPMAPMTPMPPMTPMEPLPAIASTAHVTPMPQIGFGYASDGFHVPRPQWIQGDPADSLYRLAHEVLTKGDYGRAAQLFRDIAQKYPKSLYQDDLPYYEAFARYKIGTTNELQNAAKLLEPRASRLIGVTTPSSNSGSGFFPGSRRRTSEGDVVGLYLRINSVLAQRGNRGAADIVARIAQSGSNTCDSDDIQVRREAMGALSQMEASAALPIIRRVLDKKDECTVELRQRAVFILGRRGDADAASILAATAKSDPSTTVRSEAISWLPKLQGDAGVNMLEEILRTEQDERIQRSVVRTLTASDNQRARSSMRALIDRKDAPLSLRVEAINSFNNERATTDDAAYLRNLYSRADNDRMKEAVINALARIGGQENDQWVLNIARNQNESSQLRAAAISRLMRSNLPIGDLIKLYDASDSYEVRSRIVSALENRKEPEASDKLVDIIRNSTVINIRTQALNALLRKKDPRSEKIVQDILDGRKP